MGGIAFKTVPHTEWLAQKFTVTGMIYVCTGGVVPEMLPCMEKGGCIEACAGQVLEKQ